VEVEGGGEGEGQGRTLVELDLALVDVLRGQDDQDCRRGRKASQRRAQGRVGACWRCPRRGEDEVLASSPRARAPLELPSRSRAAPERPGRGEQERTGVLALLAADDDGVAPEELEELHGGGVELGDRVVVRGALIDDEAVGAAGRRARSVAVWLKRERMTRPGGEGGDAPLLGAEDGRGRVVDLLCAAGVVAHAGRSGLLLVVEGCGERRRGSRRRRRLVASTATTADEAHLPSPSRSSRLSFQSILLCTVTRLEQAQPRLPSASPRSSRPLSPPSTIALSLSLAPTSRAI